MRPPPSILSTNEWVHLKPSRVHGKGVFAKKSILKGTRIADYWGKEMKWSTFKKRYGPYSSHSLHTYPMRRVWKIMVAKDPPYRDQNVANFMNERNPPNCELKKRGLYSLRDISAGEELFLLYPTQYLREWAPQQTKHRHRRKSSTSQSFTRKKRTNKTKRTNAIKLS